MREGPQRLSYRGKASGTDDAVPAPPDFSVVSRRRFLGVSLGIAGTVLLGGGGGLLALRGRARSITGLRCLSRHQATTLEALAECLYPAGGAFELGASGLELARGVDAFLVDAPAWQRRDLGRALHLLEFGPLLFERRLATFSHLPPAERLAHFETWRRSDSDTRRQVAAAFQRLLAVLFYDRPEAWVAIDYDGPAARGLGGGKG